MKTKKYIVPSMTVISLEGKLNLLAASGVDGVNGNTIYDEESDIDSPGL